MYKRMKRIAFIIMGILTMIACNKDGEAYKFSKTIREKVRGTIATYHNVTRYYCSECLMEVSKDAKICPYCCSKFSN